MSTNILTFSDANEMRAYSREQRRQGKTVGFVPTMGFLHQGHISLVKAALNHCNIVITSIYVNPTQFSQNEDFNVYPTSQEADLKMLQDAGCQAVFLPKSLYHTPSSISNNDPNASMVVKVSGSGTTTDINNDNNNNNNNNNNINDDSHETWVTVERLSQGLCASSRPHFFRGVCTIVAKLFNIVDPDMAFFGKKDYQQWRVIERMARDLDFPIKVVGMPIQREADGLAMSSRNAMLTPKKRAAAPCIYKALQQAVESVEKERKNNNNIKNSMPMEEVVEPVKAAIQAGGGVVDYVQCVDGESLKPVKTIGSRLTLLAVAAHFGSVRLIDNIEIPA